MGDPLVFEAANAQELVLAAALASSAQDHDAIDQAVIGGLTDQQVLSTYKQEAFVPFDPVHKRTEATVCEAAGKTFKVTKGAPQVILEMCRPDAETAAKAQGAVEDLAVKGYRTLGVARCGDNGPWKLLGILPLFDPPREDSAATIADAKRHGIEIKMVTGDDVAIGREIARKLGLSEDIQPATQLVHQGRGR